MGTKVNINCGKLSEIIGTAHGESDVPNVNAESKRGQMQLVQSLSNAWMVETCLW